MNGKSKILFIVLSFFIFIGIFLRFYRVSPLTEWWGGDQADDMLVATNIVFGGHRPLIGPMLMVKNFYTPPTYYYILAGFVLLARNPIAVIGLFAISNIIAGLLLSYLANNMIDRATGTMLFILFSISNVMLAHGREIFQTFPVIPFLILSLLFFWKAIHRNRLVYLYGALVSFGAAASIYPSPWLLLPYICFLLHLFFRKRIPSLKTPYIIVIALLYIFFTSIPFYLPQVYFELTNHFPTIQAIKDSSGDLFAFHDWIQRYAIYIYQLVNKFFQIESLVKSPYSYGVSIVIIFLFALMLWEEQAVIKSISPARAKLYRKAFLFTNSLWLAASLAPIIFFWELQYHRLWVYFPPLFILIALNSRLFFETKNIMFRISVAVILIFFLVGNSSADWQLLTSHGENVFGRTEETAKYILSDFKKRGLKTHDYGVLYYSSFGYGNYNLPSIIYFLQQEDGYPVQFIRAGNDIERFTINYASTSIVYLICKSQNRILGSCNNYFLNNNPSYLLSAITISPLGKIYIYKRKNP